MPAARQIIFACALALISTHALGDSAPTRAARIDAFETQIIARMERANPSAKRWSIAERLAEHKVPGAGVAIIENGAVIWSAGYGVKRAGTDDAVTPDTVFSVGSVSKIANAALILRLAAEGVLDLDTDVNEYMTSWKVAESEYTQTEKVTLRRILSHTAGFNQHGFRDFQPGEALPTALQTLKGEPPAKHGPIRVTFEPGSMMDYSGGGITVSQQLVEDVTGLSYEAAAQRYVFEPLGMTRSTFVNPLPADHGDIARAHNSAGEPTALPRGWQAMPEMAASGLWTSANDLAKLVIALMDASDGPDAFLPAALLGDMMTREPNSWHGLGPRINGEGETFVFHHGGANDSYRARMEGHPNSGAGIVVLTNGREGAWINSELRHSAENAFDWPVKSDGGFEEPAFVED